MWFFQCTVALVVLTFVLAAPRTPKDSKSLPSLEADTSDIKNTTRDKKQAVFCVEIKGASKQQQVCAPECVCQAKQPEMCVCQQPQPETCVVCQQPQSEMCVCQQPQPQACVPQQPQPPEISMDYRPPVPVQSEQQPPLPPAQQPLLPPAQQPLPPPAQQPPLTPAQQPLPPLNIPPGELFPQGNLQPFPIQPYVPEGIPSILQPQVPPPPSMSVIQQPPLPNLSPCIHAPIGGSAGLISQFYPNCAGIQCPFMGACGCPCPLCAPCPPC